LSRNEFAELLASVLGWAPTPEMVDSWETAVTPPGDVLLAASLAVQSAPLGTPTPHGTPATLGTPGVPGSYASDVVTHLVGRRFAEVEAIFSTRSEFSTQLPPQAIFGSAKEIRACGLSLNLLCQQYSDEHLRSLIEGGTLVRCLFLDPDGESIKDREREEGYPPGQLSALTTLNLEILRHRVRHRLSDAGQERLEIATYDEPLRFNIILVDGDLAVVQPYLHADRGIDSPTFVIRGQAPASATGLYAMFDETFTWLWGRSERT
jgi:hypothetical protein